MRWQDDRASPWRVCELEQSRATDLVLYVTLVRIHKSCPVDVDRVPDLAQGPGCDVVDYHDGPFILLSMSRYFLRFQVTKSLRDEK
jgi:hypothetical protein